MKNTVHKNYFVAIVLCILSISVNLIYNRSPKGRVAGIQKEAEFTEISGVILPHHGLVNSVIAKSYEKLEPNNYSYVVVIGPNHYNPEIASVVTGFQVQEYNFDNPILDKLVREFPDILIDEEIVSGEHSIMLQIPFIKKYFPNSKIIPLIISPYASKNELYEKLRLMMEDLPDDTLFVASVDFSHGLTRDEALSKNEESINVLNNFDFDTLYSFTDEHMDSPLSVAFLLNAMELRGKTDWETWESLHSSMILNDPSLQGTSYVVGVFH